MNVKIKFLLCFSLLILSNSQILHSQLVLTTVTDPLLGAAKPTNIINGLNGETLLVKGQKIYTFTDHVVDVFTCEDCFDITDIAFVEDTMYIANGQSGIVKRVGNSTTEVNVRRTIRIISDSEGKVYAVDNLDGIVVWDGSQWTHITMSNSNIPTNDIYDFALDSSGLLWMATQVGLVTWDGSTFSTKPTPNELSTAFLDIEIDSSGNIWVASGFGGVGKFDGNQWTTFPETFSLLEKVQNLALLHDNEVWTSENGEGLFRYSNGSFEAIPYQDLGATGWEINRVLFGDTQNRLWIVNDFTPVMYLTTGGVGINNIADIKPIQTYPNPASGEVHLKLERAQIEGSFKVRLYNSSGIEVHSQLFNSTDSAILEVGNLISGIYEAIVVTNSGVQYKGRISIF